jgi:glucose-6-phosphate-specific signal transduction histidine kinase
MNNQQLDYTNQEITIELKERMKNNALTDNERMKLFRIIILKDLD